MSFTGDYGALWMASLALVPVALIAAAMCAMGVRRPATRHALFLAVLVCFTAPLLASVGVRASLPRTTPSAPVASKVASLPRVETSPKPTLIRQPRVVMVTPRTWHFVLDAPRPMIASRPPCEPMTTEAPIICIEGADDIPDLACFDDAEAIAVEPAPMEPSPTLAKSSSMAAALRDSAQRWSAALLDLRDALLALPPMPPLVWLGGIAACGMLMMFRLVQQAWHLRRATPAPAEVRAMAREAARLVGLTTPPPVRFSTHRSSPLVTCGARVCIVLPRSLWEELDDVSRRAALVHEMAHLRRRDHWVRRLELIIGAAYWWHPVVWWVRRRLNEEAELACDVWVTTLMPHCRRAYAQTLVRTTTFVGGQDRRGGRAPYATLGMATGPARRFGRRITMVMTQRSRRTPSVIGGTLCALVAALGMVVMPALACPDKEEAPKVKEVKAKAKHKDHAHAPHPDESTFDQYMQDRGDEGELKEMEGRMKALEAELKAAAGALESRSPKAPKHPKMPQPMVATPAPAAPPAMAFSMGSTAPSAEAPSTEQMSLTYHMPEGKLSELTELMRRDDVPIFITPGESTITVHATIPQHRVFYSFCVLINPDGVKVTNEEGNDVKFKHHTPEHDAALKGKVSVGHPAPAPFAGTVTMAPRAGGQAGAVVMTPRALEEQRKARAEVRAAQEHARTHARQAHEQARVHARQAHEQARVHARQAQEQARVHARAAIERQQAEIRERAEVQRRHAVEQRRSAGVLRERAEAARHRGEDDRSAEEAIEEHLNELNEAADELEERLEEILEALEDAADDERSQLESETNDLERKLAEVRAKALTLESDAARVGASAELAWAEADGFEHEADAMESAADDLEEALAAVMEEWAEAAAEFEDSMAEWQTEMEEMEAELAEELVELEELEETEADEDAEVPQPAAPLTPAMPAVPAR